MRKFEAFDLGRLGLYDILISDDFKCVKWKEAKAASKEFGNGYRLPLDFELEELFKSSLFRGMLKNVSYWSGTETAHTRARSQAYRNGGDFRSEWFQNPGNIENKDASNYFFLIRKSRSKKAQNPLFYKILELALYDSIREKYHLNNYVKNGVDRGRIFELYKQSNSTGKSFISMLKWGGIRPVNLDKVRAYRSKKLEEKLKAINAMIAKRNAEFVIDDYLTNERMKILGVNLSFITKHMYFVRPKKFIIYDRFMINLHVAMLLENDPSQIRQYFRESNKKLLFSIHRKMEGQAYSDFLNRLNTLFRKTNEELSKRGVRKFTSLGDFEAFLFGAENPKDLSNPRELIRNFIIENRK